MGTTINVVCYKSKVLKNNESPLMVRICKDGKRKYESIGISLDPILSFENVLNGFIRNITTPVQSLNPRKVIDNILKSYFSFSTYMISVYHPVIGNDQIDNMLVCIY